MRMLLGTVLHTSVQFPEGVDRSRETLASLQAYRMPKWAAAYASTCAGLTHSKIACVGPSTVRGTGASSTGTLRHRMSWPSQLAKKLAPRMPAGTTAQYQAVFGAGVANSDIVAQNEQVTTCTFTQNAGVISLGGIAFRATAAASLVWAPDGSPDTIDIYWIRTAAGGTFSWALDGGSATNVSQAGVSSVQKTTISTTAEPHILTLAWVSGGTVYIIGMHAYASGMKEVSVLNMGHSGARVTTIAGDTNAYDVCNALQVVAPHLTIIESNPNDWNNGPGLGQTVADFSSANQRLITAGHVTGDVILMSSPPSDPATLASEAVQQQYVDALWDLADTNGINMVDLHARLESYSVSQPLGYYFDTLHLSGVGYGFTSDMTIQAALTP